MARQFNPKPFEPTLDSLVLADNVRHAPGSIDELAGNIQAVGLINRIICVPQGAKFRVVSGQRRTLAAKKLGWKAIPALLAEDLNEAAILLLSVSDNTQRKQMSVPDLADAVLTLQRLMPDQPVVKLAKLVNVSPAIISQAQSAMVEHSDEVKETLANGKAPMWLYFRLRKIPTEQRNSVATQALEAAWTRDEFDEQTKDIVPRRTMTVYRFVIEAPREGGAEGFKQRLKDLLARIAAFEKLGIDFDDGFRQL